MHRRIDDTLLDATVFRPKFLLGVPGLVGAWRKGNIALAHAVGTGVADDKAIYASMPRMIRYSLSEEPILAYGETLICHEPEGLAAAFVNLERLGLQPVGELGGYGITIRPRALQADLEAARAKLIADPANWISQPMIGLSVAPTLTVDGLRPRHLDL